MKMKHSLISFFCAAIIVFSSGCGVPQTQNQSSRTSSTQTNAGTSLSPASSEQSSQIQQAGPTSQTNPAGNSDVPDKDLEKFLNSADGKEFQSTAEAFTKAYLRADTKTMKGFLLDPDSKSNDFPLKDRFKDVQSLKLKMGSDDIKENTVQAEYEIAFKNEDSYDYLFFNMKKTDQKWKVVFFGMEK